jgi:hypothetical protein
VCSSSSTIQNLFPMQVVICDYKVVRTHTAHCTLQQDSI